MVGAVVLDYSFLNDKAKEIFEDYLYRDVIDIIEGAKKTKSPIEQILWVIIARDLRDTKFWPVPQKSFYFNDKHYIVDIAIEIVETGETLCVIECDGHDYHEKTKEQAINDRKRDRAFQAEGIPIFRFTGTEIYNDPYSCARELKNFLRKYL